MIKKTEMNLVTGVQTKPMRVANPKNCQLLHWLANEDFGFACHPEYPLC